MVATGQAIADLIQARQDVLLAALAVLVAERHLADDDASMEALEEAEGLMALAGRRLTWGTDAMPAARRPRGWALARPDGYILVSPQCQQGEHRECDGSPCEHPYHSQDIPGVKP
jgi:hypothetical protein